MVSLFALSQRRAPAIIALLAILLLFIAPEVSKTLAQWRASGAADGERAMMMHDAGAGSLMMMDAMPPPDADGMEHHHQHQGAAADTKKTVSQQTTTRTTSPGAAGAMDEFACGYCEMLAHFPLLVWLFIPLFGLLFTASRRVPLCFIPHFPAVFFPGACQPRAPPAR